MIPHDLVGFLYLFLAATTAGAGWHVGAWIIAGVGRLVGGVSRLTKRGDG